jgi:DNA-binding transcriptional LysR family regulator
MQDHTTSASWDDVRLFLALARARTLGAAARTLGVDGSTVSRRLAALERRLAATLFTRGRDGIAPTESAEELLPVAEELEQTMARFATSAATLERAPRGLVRITCPSDVATVLVAPLLPALLARHPGLRVDLDASESTLDLTRREADLALRTVRPTRGDLVVTRLTTITWVPVAAPALARRLGTLRELADAPWVGWGDRLAHIPPARWLATHAPAVEPALRSDHLLVQLAAVAAGAGAALLPRPTAERHGLTALALSRALRARAAPLPGDDLHLVTHRALRDVPRVRAVWDHLIACVR